MQTEVVDAVSLGERQLDFSLWGMFIEADLVVQFVMVLLVMASFWSWAIMFEKIMRIRKLVQAAEGFEESFWSGKTLDNLYEKVKKRPSHPLAMVFVAAMREWQRSLKSTGNVINAPSMQDRITKVMRVTISRELDKLEKHLDFLATVASTAVFVGLFGTVWGIMNSFQAIALTSNTSLAILAPGISEALAATALGLVAAIPAAMGYNKISTDLSRYAGRLEGFAEEFSTILSRQLDEKVQ